MAFRQPQQRPTQRPASFSQQTPAPESVRQAAIQRQVVEEDAQEWILFEPSIDEHQSTTTRTSQTPRTANDLDSLNTGLPSASIDEDLTCQGTESEDEAEELDSLDDGLHAFHGPLSPRLDQSGGAVLPTHDGLGTFPSTHPYATDEGMQEHLWQFERFNPHRRRMSHRRRSSVQKRLDALNDEDDAQTLDKHEERRLRIEKWRLEQSRAVLEEIERETRRQARRMSVVSGQTSLVPQSAITIHDTAVSTTSSRHIHVNNASAEEAAETESESFWQRITRKVIKDLMGLDDSTLCVIFGEDLPADLSSQTPTQTSPLAHSSSHSTISPHADATWEQRLLDRIARELGILADRLSEHDGAFSTYKAPSRPLQPQVAPAKLASSVHDPTIAATSQDDEASTNDALFTPTFPRTITSPAVDTSLWGIEEEPTSNTASSRLDPSQQDQEYWERDLDVGVIFRYLRNRFSPAAPSATAARAEEQASSPPSAPLPPAWASSADPNQNAASALGTSPESFRRADMIRRHHPLVSHAASISANRRRESMLSRRQHQFILQRRAANGGSSCASQSTKRTRSGGSRRYWDFPSGGAGSAAGGSAVSVTSGGYEGMMGSWGEV